MGNRVKGVVAVRRETDTESAGALRELNEVGEEAEVLPVAQRAERVKEYREKRKERAESEKETIRRKEASEGAGEGVIRKPYVVGARGPAEWGGGLRYGTDGEKGGFSYRGEDKMEERREIAFFSEPKRVKKKTQRSIFVFQISVCAAVCAIMLISKFAAPPLYENLHVYLSRLFGC